jgi:hypothetical protein
LKRTLSFSAVFILVVCLSSAQTVTSFEGIDASQVLHPLFDVDPNGAVGTKQYMEWVNVYFQAYDKVTFAPVWSAPQAGTLPFKNAGMSDCYVVGGDGIITFDHLALRWVVAMRSTVTDSNNYKHYYYCVAVSSADDLTAADLQWYAYEFSLNPVLGTNVQGNAYWPDWPKLGTWPDAYYVSFDLNDINNNYQQVGIVVCALDRTHMLTGSAANPMQCFSNPSPIPAQGRWYLGHSLIPADVNGTTSPPVGRTEYLVSIQNPVHDGKTTTSSVINLWSFHVDWATPSNSKFKRLPQLTVPTYSPGCYKPRDAANSVCVPESTSAATGQDIDCVGDRLMPRFDYRNFGSYESFLISHTVRTGVSPDLQTGIRWYELQGSGTPSLHQSGTINPGGKYMFRFLPSIAQDSAGNAAVGYNSSSKSTHPGIRASWWNLAKQSNPKELMVFAGGGDEENNPHWGDYSSMTVDPIDDCTFWYVTQYFASNQTGNEVSWHTRIANFKAPTCPPQHK